MVTTRRPSSAVVLFACLVALPVPGRAEPGRAEEILGALPSQLSDRLLEKRSLVLQEVDAEHAGLSGGYILAYAIFEKPRDEVYALLSQTARQVEFRSELRSVERIRELPDGHVDEHRIKVMLVKFSYQLRYRLDEKAGRIQWELYPEAENDLDRADGFWELYAMEDGRTLARFGTAVDIGAVLPSAFQDIITRSKVPSSVKDCRRWVDSGGTYRP